MRSRLVDRAALTPQDQEAMFRLLDSYFEGISPEQFCCDLSEKNWIVLVQDNAQNLVGFSTIRYYHSMYEGRRLGVVYSGDTIVEQSAWSSTAFFRGWIDSVRRLHRQTPTEPLYWLLLVSGFRTYRLLPVLWREFFPRFDRPTPESTQALVDHLAGERFGDCFDRTAGTVRLPRPQVLRDGWKTISPNRLKDPHVAFFSRQNPGHVQGEELVCLADLSESNLTRAGMRMAGIHKPQVSV